MDQKKKKKFSLYILISMYMEMFPYNGFAKQTLIGVLCMHANAPRVLF